MKKLIAMVMTAAMVASLVPATAFAAGTDKLTATASIVNAWTRKDSSTLTISNSEKTVPELQLKITGVNYENTNTGDYKEEVTVSLDGAKFGLTTDNTLADVVARLNGGGSIRLNSTSSYVGADTEYTYTALGADAKEALLKELYDATKDGTKKLETTDVLLITTENVEAAEGNKQKVADVNVGKVTYDLMTAAVNGIKGLGVTAPSVSASVEANRTKIINAYKADAANGIDSSATYTYTDKYPVTGERGFVRADGGQFVEYSKVVEWAKTKIGDGIITTDMFKGDEIVATMEDFSTWLGDGVSSGAKKTLGDNLSSNNTELYTVSVNKIDGSGAGRKVTVAVKRDASGAPVINTDRDEVTLVIEGPLEVGDVISLDLESVLDKAKSATVSITSDDIKISNDDEDMTYVSIESEGVTASIKKVATVAEDEHTALSKNLVIKSTVEDFAVGQVIELKLNNGFEFYKVDDVATATYQLTKADDDLVKVEVLAATDKIEIDANDIEIEATDAKAGSTAVITVKATNKNMKGTVLADGFNARTTVEVMKVVDYTVVLSKDDDEDVPVIYNGVNVDNYGLTDDSDHWSVEVTAEETFPGAWSFRKGFNFELPAGVYVTNVDIKSVEGFLKTTSTGGVAGAVNTTTMGEAFLKAYQDGDNLNFEFDKRVFDDVDATLAKDEAKVTFELQLVADPGFVGDVTLKLTGELVDEQEVVIAKFVSPFEIKAEQNDLKIDYRYTEVPTSIVVKEAEDGLWDADKAEFAFYVEKPDYIVFEDDPTYTVDDKSGMKLKDAELTAGNWDGGSKDFDAIHFLVDKESAEPAEITISDLSLFMQRSIPAGAYDLNLWTSMWGAYEAQAIYGPSTKCGHEDYAAHLKANCDETGFVGDLTKYSETVKEAFVNVVTAGREQDDASFTTKVVVPVGEKYIIAGEVQYDLDVPAYINANGYTMLPVRAVAVALGINNNNVLWDQATKTVTILYGQRIITMQVGASVVYVNGSAIPASSSVEITDSRTFLGLRDLATALGVTTINWDPATKTASLN